MLKWEDLETSHSDYRHVEFDNGPRQSAYRAKIPGGWLVKFEGFGFISSTFVPDAQRKWDGKSLP